MPISAHIHERYLAARAAYGDAFDISRDRELSCADLAFGARYGLISPSSFGRRVEWRIAEALDLHLLPASGQRGDAEDEHGRTYEIKFSAAASGTALFNQIRLAERISRYVFVALDEALHWNVFLLTHEQVASEPCLAAQHSRTALSMIRLPIGGAHWQRWIEDYDHVRVAGLSQVRRLHYGGLSSYTTRAA